MGIENPRLKYLEDVPWEKLLKLSNGKIVHSLEQLPVVIQFSDEEVFDSHVTDQKNDFSTWIRDVIGYPELADKIFNIRNKEEFIQCIGQAVIDIKRYVPPISPVIQTIAATVTPAAVIPVQSTSLPVQVTPTSVVQPVSNTEAKPASSPVVSITPPVISMTPVVPETVASPAPVAVQTPVASVPVQSSSSSAPIQPAPSLIPVISISPAPLIPTSTSAVPNVASVVSVASAEAKPEIKSEIKPEIKPDINSEVKPDTKPDASPEAKPDERYEFEEVFKTLLDDVESEVFVWDTQSG